MGLPVEILNEKYERRSYEFNFGLIVAPEEYEESQDKRNILEQVIRKMATNLTMLEVDHEFLWANEKKKFLAEIVRSVFERLTSQQSIKDVSFCIPLDFQSAYSFKFQTKHDNPPEVRSFDVPVFLDEEAQKKYYSLVESTSDIL